MYIFKGFCDMKGNMLLNFISNKVVVYLDEVIKFLWNFYLSLEIRFGIG